jgi:protein transport protein SEC31
MARLQIERTATIAFVPPHLVPVNKRDSLFIATGTVAGALDASFNTSADLELFEVCFSKLEERTSKEAINRIGGFSTQAR